MNYLKSDPVLNMEMRKIRHGRKGNVCNFGACDERKFGKDGLHDLILVMLYFFNNQ